MSAAAALLLAACDGTTGGPTPGPAALKDRPAKEIAQIAAADAGRANSVSAKLTASVTGQDVTGTVEADRAGHCVLALDFGPKGTADVIVSGQQVWYRMSSVGDKYVAGSPHDTGGMTLFCQMALGAAALDHADVDKLTSVAPATADGVAQLVLSAADGTTFKVTDADTPYPVEYTPGAGNDPYRWVFTAFDRPVDAAPPPADRIATPGPSPSS